VAKTKIAGEEIGDVFQVKGKKTSRIREKALGREKREKLGKDILIT